MSDGRRITRADLLRMEHINTVMSELNEMTDDIYEAMADRQYDAAVEAAQKLVKRLEEMIVNLSDS